MNRNMMLDIPNKRLFRTDEVAGLIDRTARQVRNLIESGQLRAVNIGAGMRPSWGIYRESLIEFLEERDSYNQIERRFG